MKSQYFKVNIVKHTKLLFDNNYEDCFHKDKVGDDIIVREVDWPSAYYECKTGESILKTDCEIIK